MHVCLQCMYVHHICGRACGGQKTALDPLELELQMVFSHPTETEPGSSVRAAGAFDRCAESPAPKLQTHAFCLFAVCMFVFCLHVCL